MTEYTDIEVIVFEDENGNETEMQIVDEFDYEGQHVIAVCPAPDEASEDEDEVSFFYAEGEDDDLEMTLIEDAQLIDKLGDVLEDRLLNK